MMGLLMIGKFHRGSHTYALRLSPLIKELKTIEVTVRTCLERVLLMSSECYIDTVV